MKLCIWPGNCVSPLRNDHRKHWSFGVPMTERIHNSRAKYTIFGSLAQQRRSGLHDGTVGFRLPRGAELRLDGLAYLVKLLLKLFDAQSLACDEMITRVA